MAGLSYKPLSYTELSTFQLLCIKDVYQLIDTICADKYADWNIIDFEKAVVSNKYPNSYDEQSVRAAIESSLLKLDAEKPRKRYLEQGKHYAYELFLYLPEQFRFDEQPYKLLWQGNFPITNCPSKKSNSGSDTSPFSNSLICGYIQTEPYM